MDRDSHPGGTDSDHQFVHLVQRVMPPPAHSLKTLVGHEGLEPLTLSVHGVGPTAELNTPRSSQPSQRTHHGTLASVRENVVVRKPCKIKPRAHREKTKRGLGKRAAPITVEHHVELFLDSMQVQNIGRCIVPLLV